MFESQTLGKELSKVIESNNPDAEGFHSRVCVVPAAMGVASSEQ